MSNSDNEDVLKIFGKAKGYGVRGSGMFAFSFIIFPIIVPSIAGAISIFNSIRGFAKYYGEKRMSIYALGVFPYAIGHTFSTSAFLIDLVTFIVLRNGEPFRVLSFIPPAFLVAFFLPSLMGAILLGRSFNILSEESGERMFKKMRLLLPIDAISKLMGAGLMWNSSSQPIGVCMYILFLISMIGTVPIVAWVLAAKAFGKLTFREFW